MRQSAVVSRLPYPYTAAIPYKKRLGGCADYLELLRVAGRTPDDETAEAADDVTRVRLLGRQRVLVLEDLA